MKGPHGPRLVALVSTVIVLAFIAINAGSNDDFSVRVWKDEPERRAAMANSLGPQILGKTLGDVVALLGPPSHGPYTAGPMASWYAGPENKLFPIDSNYFVVEVRDGRVSGWVLNDNDHIRPPEWFAKNLRR